ncbi:MAG: hypothetical protein K0R67_3587 [Paenibacillus sp.]|nr:hypothetical protein [Paenibacillus sp.]
MNSYRDGMNEIQADEALKEKMIREIRASRSSRSKGAAPFPTLRKASVVLGVACILTWIAAFGLPLLQNIGSDPSMPGQARPFFSGFVITALAADGTPVEVKPNVTFPLGQYSPLMSSVPGFPIRIVVEEADLIQLRVTDGNLLSWTPPNFQVRNKGRETDIRSGDTIYWSPLTGSSDSPIATNCTIEIKAFKNNKEMGTRIIEIRSDTKYLYTGKLVEQAS